MSELVQQLKVMGNGTYWLQTIEKNDLESVTLFILNNSNYNNRLCKETFDKMIQKRCMDEYKDKSLTQKEYPLILMKIYTIISLFLFLQRNEVITKKDTIWTHNQLLIFFQFCTKHSINLFLKYYKPKEYPLLYSILIDHKRKILDSSGIRTSHQKLFDEALKYYSIQLNNEKNNIKFNKICQLNKQIWCPTESTLILYSTMMMEYAIFHIQNSSKNMNKCGQIWYKCCQLFITNQIKDKFYCYSLFGNHRSLDFMIDLIKHLLYSRAFSFSFKKKSIHIKIKKLLKYCINTLSTLYTDQFFNRHARSWFFLGIYIYIYM